MSIRLSICIPTYNRGAFIGQTIESIICQATDDVEVIISDNASTDNTEEVVREYQQRFPRIIYFRWEKNMGADRNYLKVIELANGEYCWFMGSDDRVEAGGIAAVLEALKKYPGLAGITLNRNAYNVDMSQKIPDRPPAGKLDHDKLFKSCDEFFPILGHYIGYIPAQLVNRELWNEAVRANDPTPYFNAYVHIYVIANMMKKNPNWLYIHKKCVGWRSGNSSFLGEGLYKFLEMVALGPEKILRDVFGRDTMPYNGMMRHLASVDVFYMILKSKLNNAPALFFRKSFILCIRTYWRYPIFWLKTFPLFVAPKPLLKIMHHIYRSVKT